MNSKAQGALEYLLIMAAAVIISAGIIVFMMSNFEQGVGAGQEGTNEYLCITLGSDTDECRAYIASEYGVDCPPKENGFKVAFENSIPIGCKRDGLIWAPKDEAIKYNYSNIDTICSTAHGDGWRLPTIEELGGGTGFSCTEDTFCPVTETTGICVNDATKYPNRFIIENMNSTGWYLTSTKYNLGYCVVGRDTSGADKRSGQNTANWTAYVRCVK